MSNESSANSSEKPTDAFLREVAKQEEEAARKSQQVRDNPMNEEGLRLQVHNNDPDQMKLLHSYYAFKSYSRCKDCGMQLFSLEEKPRMAQAAKEFVDTFDDELMPNGHPASSRYKHYKGWDGAGRTAALLAAGLRRLEQGQPDIVIKAFFLDCGISNKASDYVALVHEMYDGNLLYSKWKKLNGSHAAEKNNGGVTKT